MQVYYPRPTQISITFGVCHLARGFKKGHKRSGGRKPGSKNKLGTDVREAFVKLMQLNTENMTGWLQHVAQGQTGRWKDSKGVLHTHYLVKPDPARAMDIMMAMAEYHIPKLSRVEQTGLNGGPIVVQATPTDEGL